MYMSQEIDVLFAQAHDGALTPIEFCKALDQHGVNLTRKMIFLRDAFGLPLEQAKKIVLEADGRSIKSWADEMGNVIDELSSPLNSPDDSNAR